MDCKDSFTHYFIHFTSRIQTGLDVLSWPQCCYEADAAANGVSSALFDRLMVLHPGRRQAEFEPAKRIYPVFLPRARELDRQQSCADILEANSLVLKLLVPFFRGYDQPDAVNTVHGLARFRVVIDYVRDNMHSAITLDELAELVDLSPAYFSNLFRRLMGLSPIQYINKRRIDTAQQLLLSTDHTLYQIARDVGFTDVYYLSRLFKKVVGIAPSFYRRRRRF